mgnify:CR=1 FL=1
MITGIFACVGAMIGSMFMIYVLSRDEPKN